MVLQRSIYHPFITRQCLCCMLYLSVGISEAQREQWRQVEVDKRSILGYIPQVIHCIDHLERLLVKYYWKM